MSAAKKTILLFPGIDALEDPRYREPSLRIPGVDAKIEEITTHLSKIGADPLDLDAFYKNTFPNTTMPIRELGMATLASQKSLFDLYVAENGKPDALMGCSLGDIARTVCADSVGLLDAVDCMVDFGERIVKIRDGLVARVRTNDPYTDAEIREIESTGIEICVFQTERHFLIAGTAAKIIAFTKAAAARSDLKCAITYPFPLHSSIVKPAAEPVRPRIDRTELRKPSIPLFSSLYCRFIEDPDELREETYENMIRTVKFRQAVEAAAALGFRRFVNIGPAPTLLSFLERIPLPADVELIDYFGVKTNAVRA